MNRRGISDVPFYIAAIFIIALTLVIGKVFVKNISDAVQDSPHLNDSINATGWINENYVDMFDSLFLMIFIVLGLAIPIAASQLRSHPAFLFFAIILLIIMILLMGVFSETWGEIQADAQLGSVATSFTIMDTIMTNLPVVMMFMVVLAMIVLYGKRLSQV